MEYYVPPPRILAPTEGRNSITYNPYAPLQDTTNLYFIDNKSTDIESLNYANNHSDFFTNIIQNADLRPADAATQDIKLDERSRWAGQLVTYLKTNCPNVTEYNNSNTVRVKLMTDKTDPQNPIYEWFNIEIPEGNYTGNELLDFLNNAIIENYLEVGRQNDVTISDIGVKFDTRHFGLGQDPITTLITPGSYTYKAFHPDIVLLPHCGIDFTYSRLNNMLGIRKRFPYTKGFKIMYDDLENGNIPALMDVDKYPTSIEPIRTDKLGNSYHVVNAPNDKGWYTLYRSWALAYHRKGPIREKTLLTVPDITGGLGQLYWSLPDCYKAPITFSNNNSNVDSLPVVGMQLFPIQQRIVYNTSAVYSQLIEELTNNTKIFNRFPDHEILKQPPYGTLTWISENVPSVADHGQQPLKNSLTGVQRLTLTDDRRRPCPYIYKTVARVTPRVISSATLQ